MISWNERMANLRATLDREPTLGEMIETASIHRMTPEEVEAQYQSWVRGMTSRCEHGVLDFETCPECRSAP